MRTEHLLAACLDARARGQSPTPFLDTATRDQRAELEALLALIERLEHLAPPLPPAARQAMYGRLVATMLPASLHLVH